MKRRIFALAALVCVFANDGYGQRAAPKPAPPPSLLGKLGTPAAERLLASDSSAERRRGLARLSALGSPRAVELLARALDPGGAARGAEEHLAAVRALAPHVKQPLARDALVRALSSPAVDADEGPLSDWVQSAAALALARSQDAAALSALGRALRKPGHVAELTEQALLAYPPLDITPILRVPGAPTRELCRALGALGDRRAEGYLREIVRRAAPDARAAAALALSRLGSEEVVPLARHWLRSERQPVLLVAAAQILAERAPGEAGPALATLAENEGTRAASLTALLSTDGQVPAPAWLNFESAGVNGPGLLELFARGNSWAAPRLERALAAPESAGLALHALSRTPGAYARARLERALKEPKLGARAVRALALRAVRLGEQSRALTERLSTALGSTQPAERAAAAFARAALEPAALLADLRSKDAYVVRAVARLAGSGESARVAVMRLASEKDPTLRVALASGLADPEAATLLPTPQLLELVHEAGPGSLLAASALAARLDADLLPLVRELLGSGDPWLRAHTLLGLGVASAPEALGLIENAYQFEPDRAVRHAAVVALSRRAEPVRVRALTLAAELETAPDVREAARRALSGQRLASGVSGPETAWLELSTNPGLLPQELPAAQLRFGAGLALPVVADADGVVALVRVDPAAVQVRLALLGGRVNVPGARP
ncbi:MAG: Chromosome partition protein smc [Polyangiaceae bacterium]|nr:Chromosome partition protein smc [Polyangiaceae bacterium]